VRTGDPEPLREQEGLIRRLAGLESFEAGPAVEKPAQSATVVLATEEVYVSLEGLIDLEAERARKMQELEKARGHLKSIEAKLANENFVNRAKPEVVQRERERADEVRERIAKIEEALKGLG
jgi:valyl-tRNA synthetase